MSIAYNTMEMKNAFDQTVHSFKMFLPILVGVLMLVSLVMTLIPEDLYTRIFTGNFLFDPVIGAVLGSVSSGNPLTSYIIGGELKYAGVSVTAVVAFILSWVTVGIIQFPAEALMLGKKFALVRNGVSFVTAIILAVLVTVTLKLL